MTSRHRRFFSLNLIPSILIFCLAISCTSQPGLVPAAVTPAVTASPTPFQPQSGISDVPYNSPSLPQVEPTFTPYPTPLVPADILPTPLQNIPTPGGLPFYLSNVNNPLTGLPVADPSLLERRPMAIKVANAPDYVRPQSGLTLADVVYEYYIEWGDTRFIAVMYGNDAQKVGPVRSGRYFDEHITRMYHAFFVFKFADPREYSYFKGSDLLDFLVVPGNASCPPFVLGPDQGREVYNNFFFDTTKFAACIAKKGVDNSRQPIRSGFFSSAPVAGALKVNRIYTRYSSYSYNYWEYDAATRKYFRYQETETMINGKPEAYAPLTDAETGLPVTADNVVMLFVPHTFATQNEQEDEIFHVDMVGSGEAFLFRDGTAFPARWYRTDIDQPILIATLDGIPLFLRPGRTFYQVIGETSTYTQNGTDWRFYFDTP